MSGELPSVSNIWRPVNNDPCSLPLLVVDSGYKITQHVLEVAYRHHPHGLWPQERLALAHSNHWRNLHKLKLQGISSCGSHSGSVDVTIGSNGILIPTQLNHKGVVSLPERLGCLVASDSGLSRVFMMKRPLSLAMKIYYKGERLYLCATDN